MSAITGRRMPYMADFQRDLEWAYLLHIFFYTFFSMRSDAGTTRGYGFGGIWAQLSPYSKSLAMTDRGGFRRIGFWLHFLTPIPWAGGITGFGSNALTCVYILPSFLILLRAILRLIPTGSVVHSVILDTRWSGVLSLAIRWFSKYQFGFYLLLNVSLMFPVFHQIKSLSYNYENMSIFESSFHRAE